MAVIAPLPIVPAVIAPVAVTFLNPEISIFPSATKALFAAAVPSVIPSNFSKSSSFKSALPIIKLVPAVIAPVAVTFLNLDV